MEKVCIDILNQWAKYVDYDENQTSFNLASWNYDTHETTKKLKHIIEDYDPSGVLAVLTVKHLFYKMLDGSRIKLLDAISHPEELKTHKDMLDAFNDPAIKAAEVHYIDVLKAMVRKVIGKDLLGDFDVEAFETKIFDRTDNVIRSLDKCKVEVYKRGGKLDPLSHFSSGIHVFPSLAECLFSLETAQDGMYLCFIDVSHSADGYFGFFVKNNGNLFSVNERVNEVYKGQHQHSRNGRWTEAKVDDIFPYDFIFSYENYDYKGYSHTYSIDETKLAMFDMGEDAYLPLLIAMMMLSMWIKDDVLDAYPQVYVDSLLTVNVPLLQKDENVLTVIAKSELAQITNSVNLEFDYDKIMSGEALDEFDKEHRPENERGHVSAMNNNQIFVDMYGEGFQIQPNILSTQKLLTDGKEEYVPEFVGSEYRFREQAFYEIRKQLADYIREQMHEEYVAFGGIKAVDEWFAQTVMKNRDKIRKMAVEFYVSRLKGENSDVWPGWQPTNCENKYFTSVVEGQKYVSSFDYGTMYLVNKATKSGHDWVEDVYDDDNGNLCTVFFVTQFIDWTGLENFFGEPVPKIVKGWRKNGNSCSGNSLLNITDAVEAIGTPFERWESEKEPYNRDRTFRRFSICIGFSKRGFTALCKEHGYDLKKLRAEYPGASGNEYRNDNAQ